MGTTPFIGTEALASGALTRSQLRWNYDALHPDVYLAKGARRHLWTRIEAAWLWTRRRGIVAGRAAVGQYAHTSVERAAPVELLAVARRREPGVITRNERIAEDEIRSRGDMRVTTAERTALDLARHLPRRWPSRTSTYSPRPRRSPKTTYSSSPTGTPAPAASKEPER